MRIIIILILLLIYSGISDETEAISLFVKSNESIQEQINNASDGDFIFLQEGIFNEDINFPDKDIQIIGKGWKTVLRGTGNLPVVTAEGGRHKKFGSIEKIRIIGGKKSGAILIKDSSFTVKQCWIINNRSDNGSTITVINGSPVFSNNIIAFNKNINSNKKSSQIYTLNSSPVISHNTIIEGNDNAITLEGLTYPWIIHNIIAFNGREKTGIGINHIDYSGIVQIEYNLFFKNGISDLFISSLGGNVSTEEVQSLSEDELDEQGILMRGNLEGNPYFKNIKNLLRLELKPNSAAIDSGNPISDGDQDGSREDIGASGGSSPI